MVLAKITGPKAEAESLQKVLVEKQPQNGTSKPRLLGQADLQKYSTMRLVSATENEPSDMALMHAARQQKIDYLLTGEILQRRGTFDAATTFTVSWRLLDVGDNRLIGGTPVTVTGETLARDYPQLETRPDRQESLIEATAVESWKLLIPHVQTYQVELANSKFKAGSKAVQDANRYAQLGNWRAAEQIWENVYRRHPRQHAAVHNLALAAAARQDFGAAKSLAQQALKQHDSEKYRNTVVWIESRQIDLTNAFNLPAPSEGWLFAPDGITEQSPRPTQSM